ncbi:hypothetical protein TARUN_3986 [Trichoderma arundinaceum]|uniref:Mid2 domain-containing protein n=1 Tax=Trichoderma arundinaceum TaxID=490622 RepID=A0A395NQD6_TRIAR|nr:hypothetical protein TARUN_3986 [Trichoderma arundinaceum]
MGTESGTVLGPLTTTWTLPKTCSVYIPGCSTCDQGFAGQSCSATGIGEARDNTACWPPATSGVASPAWPFRGWGFYSPGLSPKLLWDVVQRQVDGFEINIPFCVSPRWNRATNGNTCMATVTHESVVPTGLCDGSSIIDSALATLPDVVTIDVTYTTTQGAVTETTDTLTTSTRTMILYAPMFQLNFQASDLPATTTASSSTSSQSSTSAADDDGSANSSSGLSSGAKIGLGVGLGLGVAFLLAFAAFIFYYRRSKRNQLSLGSELPNNQVSEADESSTLKPSPAPLYEMGIYRAPAELVGDNPEGGYKPQDITHRY